MPTLLPFIKVFILLGWGAIELVKEKIKADNLNKQLKLQEQAQQQK